jgi:sRNA-binding protein
MLTTNRRPLPREQLDELIQFLATTYPKCFFTDKYQKRPLKKNILADLEKDRVLDDDRREAAVSFYLRGWNYEYCLQAGAKRIDLNGNEVGTVTETEAREASARVQAQKDELRKKRNPIEVMRSLHATGQVSTDMLSKITAPPLPEKTVKPTLADVAALKTPTAPPPPEKTMSTPADAAALKKPSPELARLHTLWGTVDNIFENTPDPTLRNALGAVALRVLISESASLIGALEKTEN